MIFEKKIRKESKKIKDLKRSDDRNDSNLRHTVIGLNQKGSPRYFYFFLIFDTFR